MHQKYHVLHLQCETYLAAGLCLKTFLMTKLQACMSDNSESQIRNVFHLLCSMNILKWTVVLLVVCVALAPLIDALEEDEVEY